MMAKGFGTLKTNHDTNRDKKTKKSVPLSPIKHPQGQNLLQLAIKAHKSGKLLQASNLCQKILAQQPDHIDAWLLLANIYRQQDELEQAITAYQQLTQLQPNQVNFWNNLGVLYIQQGEPDKAIATFEQAITIQPDFADTYGNLGELYREQDQLAAAEKYLQQAIKLKPDYPGAYYNLGNLYHTQEKIEQAITAYQQAIKIQPDYANAHNNLGSMYHYQGDLKQARDCYDRAIQLKPNYAIAYFNLGNVHKDQGKIILAIQAYHRAIEIQPDYSNAYINLGLVYRDCGQMEQSLKYLHHVSRSNPDDTVAHQNLLYYLHYSNQYSPEQIYQEHRRWAKHQQSLLPQVHKPHTNQPNPEKKIRLGYISGDFRTHSVAYFLEPIFTQHNREQFTLCCYAKNPCNDETTERFKQLADIWHDINRLNDEEVANLIRKDEIDILVDLSGHTGGTKLLALARQPAPVQVTYLGYPNTTGLDTVNYRFTDSFADPPGKTEQLHSEQLIRLPHGFLCYQPPADTPEVNSLPSLEKGYVTFGSFNNLAKVSDRTISYWAKILHGVPHSRLILKTKPLQDEDIRDRIYRSFEQEGINRERLTLLGWTATTEDHFRLYHQVDLALDTYPYHGTTTTCEAMWMGVPVITLAGKTHVSRVGVSLLSGVGLPEFITNSEEEYVSKAINLANKRQKLADLRCQLRPKLQASPLMSPSLITQSIEKVYRSVWQSWCREKQSLVPAKPAIFQKVTVKPRQSLSLNQASAQNLARKDKVNSDSGVTIFTLHHLSATGGTLISKCLAAIPNVVLLSEINPFVTNYGFNPFDPIQQFTRYGLLTPKELQEIFLERITLIVEKCQQSEQKLIIRDHAHSDFLLAHSATKPHLLAALQTKYTLKSIITLRNPIDSWLAMLPQGWHRQVQTFDRYCDRYLKFLDTYQDYPYFLYENFVRQPDVIMEKMCRYYGIDFDPNYKGKFSQIKLSGDSGRTSSEISPRPRRKYARSFAEEVKRSINFNKICQRLGYGGIDAID